MFFVLCLYGCQTSITRVLPVPQYPTYLTFQTSLVRSIRAIIKSIALFVYFLAVLYFPLVGRTVANGESEIKCCKTLGKVSCHSLLSSVALQLPFSCPSSLNFQSRWTAFLFRGTVCCQRIAHKNFFSIFQKKKNHTQKSVSPWPQERNNGQPKLLGKLQTHSQPAFLLSRARQIQRVCPSLVGLKETWLLCC